MSKENLTSNDLAARLADLEERLEQNESSGQSDATFIELKAELDTIVTSLRSGQQDPFEQESSCQRVTHLVQEIGQAPEDCTMSHGSDKTTSLKSVDLTPHSALGQYELLDKLGEGGMGAVYKARHTRLDKIVAVKVLPADRMKDASAVARFEREMRAVGKLDHANIVRAMDAGEVDGMHFLVMEYVKGMDLSQLSKQLGPLSIPDACELVRQAAVGLDEAFEHGMVHRDIKPGNLILARQRRKPPVVKILDMGLALLSEHHLPDQEGLTTTGQMMGTLDYMAPEQGGDSKNVDIRADIYALGATLYRLLTGHVIYHGDQFSTPMQKMMALSTLEAPPLDLQCSEVPAELAAIVHRMLAKNAEDRYATPEEVVEALAPYCAGADLTELLNRALADESQTPESSFSPTHRGLAGSYTDTALPEPSHDSAGNPPSAMPASSADNGKRKLTPGILAGLAAGAIALLAALVFFLQTPKGTLRVEISDPEIQVRVKGTDIVLEGEDEEIRLTVGEQNLIVKRGDFEFETKDFVLKRDEVTRVKVEWLDGQIKVANGNTMLGSAAPPQTPVDVANIQDPPAVGDSESKPDTQPRVGTGRTGVGTGTNGALLCSLGKPGASTKLDVTGVERLFTIEAWLYLSDDPESTSSGPIFGVGAHSAGGSGIVGIIYGSRDDMLTFDKRTQIKAPSDVWFHCAAVYDGPDYRFYLDGKLVGSGKVEMQIPEAKMNLGFRLPGMIDEVRLSKVARYTESFTPAQRFESDNDTVALYHCDELSGPVVKDSSENGLDAYIHGATWVKGRE